MQLRNTLQLRNTGDLQILHSSHILPYLSRTRCCWNVESWNLTDLSLLEKNQVYCTSQLWSFIVHILHHHCFTSIQFVFKFYMVSKNTIRHHPDNLKVVHLSSSLGTEGFWKSDYETKCTLFTVSRDRYHWHWFMYHMMTGISSSFPYLGFFIPLLQNTPTKRLLCYHCVLIWKLFTEEHGSCV